ncbi:MAG: hypothetical protein OHK0023_21320 [Anaerolineae bacterium]
MRLVLTVVILLFGTCFALMTAARAAGTASEPSPDMVWFTDVNGKVCDQICLLGVTSEARNHAEITAIVHAHPLMQKADFESYETGIRAISSEALIQLLIAPLENPPGVIFFAQFTDPESAPELGDVMARFGFPDRVDVVSWTPYLHVLMYYLEYDVVIDSFGRGSYSPHTRVNSITLTDLVRLRYNTSKDARIWRGFIYRAR